MFDEASSDIRQAVAHLAAGDYSLAEAICRSALKQNPSDVMAVHTLGLVCHRSGRLFEGIELLFKSVKAEPNAAHFHCNLAAALGAMGRLDEAVSALKRAIELRPDHIVSYANLGAALERQQAWEVAEQVYRRSIVVGGGGPAHHLLANLLKRLDRWEEAEQEYGLTLQLDPQRIGAWTSLAAILLRSARQNEAIAAHREALRLQPSDAALYSSLLYDLHYCPGLSRAQLFQEHLEWAERHERSHSCHIQPHLNDPTPTRRLRIGYVSPDFRRHSAAAFFRPLLLNHDPTQVEVYAYSASAANDGVTKELKNAVQIWRDITELDDDQAALLIRSDRIDILVDLTGHMSGNRLLVFARKPAPIQVSYIGHPNTSGMASMDYRFSDVDIEPDGTDQYFTERLVRLPRIFACYQVPQEKLQTSELPASRNGFITFGCLNNPAKVTADAIALWCRILHQVPRSQLIINIGSASNRFHALFASEGIDPNSGRIEFVKSTHFQAYLEQFNRIDIALDPFPYCGHTTSCDGFWMGVPLITLSGDSFAARTGVSLLRHISEPSFIAESQEHYVEIAVKLAANLPRLEELRRSLRERLCHSPLTDGTALARDVDEAYRRMWQRWCQLTCQAGATDDIAN